MMNIFKHYLPNYMNFEVSADVEFSSLEEFLALPRIKYISDRPDFVKFTCEPYMIEWGYKEDQNNYMVLAHYSDGSKWVIGFTINVVEGIENE